MKRLLLILLVLPSCGLAQTIVNVDPSTTIHAASAVQRPGINMGTPTSYDSGQYYKNLIQPGNVGGEGALLQQIWYVDNGAFSGSTTTIAPNNNNELYDGVPTNWWVGAQFQIIQSITGGPENGCTATITANTSANTGTVVSYSISATNVVTVNYIGPTYATGTVVYPNFKTATFLNKSQVIISARPGSFTFNFTHARVPPTTDSGTLATSPVYTWSPACAATPTPGDVIVLKQQFPMLTNAQMLKGYNMGVTHSGSGIVTQQNADLCSTCGASSFRLDTSAGGGSQAGLISNRVSQEFVHLSGRYDIKFMMKLASGFTTITVAVGGTCRFGSGGTVNACGVATGTCNLTFTPTSSWTQASGTCTGVDAIPPARGGNTALQFTLNQTGTGVTYIDNIDMEPDPSQADPTNATIFSDDYVNELKKDLCTRCDGPPATLRYNIAPNSETLDSWILPANARLMESTGLNLYWDGAPNTSLQDFLQLCHVLRVDPYIILPITLTTTDAANLVDFLYGGSGTTYGAKRISLGGPSATSGYATWFGTIHMSLGNENWNQGFVGQILGWRQSASFAYQDYGTRAGTIFATMRGMASYIPSQTELIVGVQQVGAGGGFSNIADYAHPDGIEFAQYTQYDVSDYTSNALLFTPWFAEPYLNMHQPNSQEGVYQDWTTIQGLSTCGPSHTATCIADIYEEGNSTFGGSITQAAVTGFPEGGAYGVGTFNQFLQTLDVAGIKSQNLYAATGYSGTFDGRIEKIWGSAVDYGGTSSVTNASIFGGIATPRPIMLGLRLANQIIIGKMIGCSISGATGAAPYDLPSNNNSVKAQKNVPTIYAYCFQSAADPTHYAVAIVNESLTTSYPITWAGKAAPAGGVTRMRLAPTNPYDTNEAPGNWVTNTAVAKVSLATATGLNISSGDTVPPDSVSVYLYSTGTSPK